MKAYYIKYTVNNQSCEAQIDAKDIDSAKNKIGRKHGYKTTDDIKKNIKISDYSVIGYF